MTPVAPRIALDISYVTLINHEMHFSWQGQYLVKLEDDSCCSAHCTGRFTCGPDHDHEIHFSWQAQYLVNFEDDAHCTGRFIFGQDQS